MHHKHPELPNPSAICRVRTVKVRRRIAVESAEKAASDARKKRVHCLYDFLLQSYFGTDNAPTARAELQLASRFEHDQFIGALQFFDAFLVEQGWPPRPEGEPF